MSPPKKQRREPTPEVLFRLADQAELVADPTVQRLLAATAVTNSTSLKQRIESVLATKAVQKQRQPFNGDAPRVSFLEDRLSLGVTITGSSYNLQQDDLTQHLLVVGRSGAGKTTLFYNLMDQLTVPFWSFDLKQDYRHLLQTDEELLVLPWTELKFNPLKPPTGVSPRRWSQVFSEMFGHATALLSGSKNHFMKQVIELYRLYSLFDEVSPPYPSLYELEQLLTADKINYARKTSRYRDTVVNRLEAMNLTAGTIFDCSEGYDIEQLLTKNVVFEFDGLGTDVQNFLMEMLIAYVYEYRLAHNQRGGKLRHVFFMDEGKSLFSVYKERQDAAGIPAIDVLTSKMREFGEGLVVADQEASKLTDSIKANTTTKVLLATGSSKQFGEMAEAMRLTPRQMDRAQRIDIGEAIVQTGGNDPVPVMLDRYDLEKGVTDTELRQYQQHHWDRLWSTPRKLVPALDNAVQHDNQQTKPIPDDPSRDSIELSEDAERLLADIFENPFASLSNRYEAFSSAYAGNKAKNELVEKQLVTEQQLKDGTSTRKLLQVTEDARAYAENYLNVEMKQRGRGGIIHQYWQHQVKAFFEATGGIAMLELFDADVYVNVHDAELAVEVAMGNNDREIEHVKQRLEDGFDTVWVLCRNEAVRDGLRKRMADSGLLQDSVTFRLFRELRDAMDELNT